MTAEPVAVHPTLCPLCEAPTPVEGRRCPDCGYDLAGVGGRPGAFSRGVLLWTAIGFLAVYIVTLVIVALTR